MAKKEYRDNVIVKQRMLIIFGILFLLFFALGCRMTYVMVIQSDWLKNKAVDQWTNEVKIEARRGRILDRHGHELAISANVYRVDMDMNATMQELSESIPAETRSKMSQVEKEKELAKKLEELAQRLALATNMDPQEVSKLLNKKRANGAMMGSITLKRRIEKEEADKVRDLKARGVIISADTRRYYPNNNFLAQVIGHTNSDGIGLTGLEKKYNEELSGKPGKVIAENDNKSKQLPDTITLYNKPIDGRDLVLTIDEMIQHFAEKTALDALNKAKAKAVTVIVMDPKNGEVLAMANKPDYNPNTPWEKGKTVEELEKEWKNRSISATFEPGSIFKVITASAALAEGVVNESNQFVCNGSYKIGGITIHCANGKVHGVQNIVELLKNSCNIGFSQVGKLLGVEKLNKHILEFGFGRKTGIDLIGEENGIIKKPEKTSESDLATISFGQTNTVSAIQYLTAFNAIANGGKWIRPHLMKSIEHFDENNKKIVDREFDDFAERRVEEANVVGELRGYLERVVTEGGGRNAYIDGYHIAGKTGTAQKINPSAGGYEPGKYISSFAGMAPSSDPKITVLVSVDEPDASTNAYYGSMVAAPAAQQVFYDVLNYMSFKADVSKEDVAKSLLRDVVIPEIRGLKKEDAIKVLKEYGLAYQLEGEDAYIGDVSPKPGYSVKESAKIILYTNSSPNYNKIVIVPNLRGYSRERANELLNNLGLKGNFDGEGIISEQNVEPSVEVSKGTTITFKMTQLGD